MLSLLGLLRLWRLVLQLLLVLRSMFFISDVQSSTPLVGGNLRLELGFIGKCILDNKCHL